MALNKSNKNTPTSRSGYFTELTASAGKQTNYLLPVRIKITPKNSVAPLSDGKKNAAPKFKPVLVKDLLRSTEKGKFHNTTVTSVSTQKKKKNSSKVADPYLNTQSCYKPKNNEQESTLFNRKSLGTNKVRRQLYQNLDSSQKILSESSEVASNINKTKKTVTKSLLGQNKIRKSLLLPPNSIKNIIIRKSEASFKAPGKQSIRSSKSITTGKSTKNILPVSETVKPKRNDEKSIYVYEDEADMDSDFSSPGVDVNEKKQFPEMRDNFTMTSPCLNKTSKIIADINTSERPSVIMSPSKSKSSLNLISAEPPCAEMQNLKINPVTCNCAANMKISNDAAPKIDFDNMVGMNQNNLIQMKTFLEQSIQASEDHTLKLKQLLGFLNNISNAAKKADSSINDFSKFDGEGDISKVAVGVGNEDDPSEASVETITLNLSSPVLESDTNVCEKSVESPKQNTEPYRRLPVPMKILISADDLNQEAKEMSPGQMNEMARLSTIGEVSCEVDLSSKLDSENKENQSDYLSVTMPVTPRTPKTPRRRTIATGSCESSGRRRSARLAAKRMSLSSLSDSDSRQDSFTMLENELNVVHEKLPSKSLPASPMKAPLTPGFAKQWDKRVERPLKEYMALKMNGTFLVTPDVKRFQSRLESTDTPHSRKSLSRKVFMELVDLYGESPDSSK